MKLIGRRAARPRIHAIAAMVSQPSPACLRPPSRSSRGRPFKVYSPRVVKGRMKSSIVAITTPIKNDALDAGESA